MNNTTIPLILDDGIVNCGSADRWLSTISAAAALLLLFAVRYYSDPDVKWIAALPVLILLLMAANHVYLAYINEAFPDGAIKDQVSLYIPIAISLFLWLLSVRFKRMMKGAIIGAAVVLFMYQLPYHLSLLVIAVVSALAAYFLSLPSIEKRAHSSTLVIVMAAVTIGLTLGLWTPDDEHCGYPRNKLVLCALDCGTITTNFTLYIPALVVPIAAVVMVIILGCLYCKKKKPGTPAAVLATPAPVISMADATPPLPPGMVAGGRYKWQLVPVTD